MDHFEPNSFETGRPSTARLDHKAARIASIRWARSWSTGNFELRQKAQEKKKDCCREMDIRLLSAHSMCHGVCSLFSPLNPSSSAHSCGDIEPGRSPLLAYTRMGMPEDLTCKPHQSTDPWVTSETERNPIQNAGMTLKSCPLEGLKCRSLVGTFRGTL